MLCWNFDNKITVVKRKGQDFLKKNQQFNTIYILSKSLKPE